MNSMFIEDFLQLISSRFGNKMNTAKLIQTLQEALSRPLESWLDSDVKAQDVEPVLEKMKTIAWKRIKTDE